MDVLRISLLREAWRCLAEDSSPSCVVSEPAAEEPDLALPAARRASPAALEGRWKVFDVSAVPLPDDAALGDGLFPYFITFVLSSFLGSLP